jgi:hypothetical protein
MKWLCSIFLKCSTACCAAFYFFTLAGCTTELPTKEIGREARISPEYSGITIPPNIAPLNFTITEDAGPYLVRFSGGGTGFTLKSRSGKVIIPPSKWRKTLANAKGGDLLIEIEAKNGDKPIKYPVIRNKVAIEPTDSYIVYRLIDPGFELWNKMGIYQRCVEDFSQKPLMLNSLSDHNCMNCHSFSQNNSRQMMFHVRGTNGGTVIYSNGDLRKVDTKTDKTISAGVYPSWHPGGRYIAFSVNNIVQTFHSVRNIRTEVTDTLSDLIIYDVEKNLVTSPPAVSTEDHFETFPSWSPDGKYLYYCSAKTLPYTQYKSIRYDILRVPFDETTLEFGTPDTVVNASVTGKSASFPRISPDGRYLMYCLTDFGNFTIWHHDSDLYIKDLLTGETIKPSINSDDTESYHSWSSSGRWIVFSSRRSDGLHTQLFFSYFDSTGTAHKPFLLPQKNPEFYDTFLKSFNVPEFITTPVDLNPRILKKVVNGKAVKAF